MRMIRLTLLALLMLLSCVREAGMEPTGEEGGIPVRLVLCPDQGITKLAGMDYTRDEGAISHWAFFIFERSTGLLAGSGVAGREGAVTKTLRTGSFELFVMANYPLSGPTAPNVAAIRTTSDFLRLTSSLSDNSPGSFVMAGMAGFMVTGDSQEVLDVQVRLQRLVVKVHLESVLRCFDNAALAARDLTLRHIYLTNVYPQNRYCEDYSPGELSALQGSWYNAMGWHHPEAMSADAATDALLCERDLDIPLRQSVSVNVNRSLYSYPNPWDLEADSHDPQWAGGRCTRLILETELEGKTYYYQATLPSERNSVPLSRNRAFRVSCTLNRLGSRDPEEEVPDAMTVRIIPDENAWERDYTIIEES